MQLISSINIPGFRNGRVKPRYSENETCKLIRNFIAADFQDDIRNTVKLELLGSQRKYPLIGNVSMFIDVYSKRDIVLHGVMKNIFDALNGVIYTDDYNIESVIITKNISAAAEDKIIIKIVTNKPIKTVQANSEDYNDFTVLSLEIDTMLCDKYLPYPPYSTYINVYNPNEIPDAVLKSKISEGYDSDVLSDLALSLTLSADSDESRPSDIDNVMLNFIVALKDVAFSAYTDISKIHILRVGNKFDTCIGIYDMLY